jgi:hypothetical protein
MRAATGLRLLVVCPCAVPHLNSLNRCFQAEENRGLGAVGPVRQYYRRRFRLGGLFFCASRRLAGACAGARGWAVAATGSLAGLGAAVP